MGFDSDWISGGVGYPVITPTKNGTSLGAITLELEIGPTGGGGAEMPEYTERYEDRSAYDEDINGDSAIVRNAARWELNLMWNSLNREGRGVLAGLVTLAMGGYQFWVKPHSDSTHRILCDLVGPWDVSELFNKMAVGYGPCVLKFKSVSPIPTIHHSDVELVDSYWLDANGVYDPEEECYWGAVGGAYTDEDMIAAWTATGKVYNVLGELVAEL